MAFSRIALGGALASIILAASFPALADCYVDSVAGNDSNDGQTESTAFESQAPLSGCGTVYYKRGSQFNEPVKISAGSTFTNYGDASAPLPAFITTDSVVNSFQGGITIDGLHLEGSTTSDDSSLGGGGTCVMLGSDSQLLNSEITDCGIGIMLFGENSLVQGNVVYDLFKMVADSEDTTVYANSVGGAEGIFINGSNNEIAYNSFINCKAQADWQGDGGYDGGATEVAVGQDATVSGLKIHHNFSYNSCGFFEVSGFGVFSDSEFYYNVSIDSAWAMLLQVNETTLSNIRWENNTFVHHADSYSPSIAMIYQAELTPGTVFLTNNLFIFDGANTFNATLDAAIEASNNLIVDYDPGVVNLAGTTAEAFDLVAGSEAIDQGLTVAGHSLDFLNRTVPDPSGVTDIGAFEFGSEQGAEAPETPETPDSGAAGAGAGGAGATTTSTAGASASTAGASASTPDDTTSSAGTTSNTGGASTSTAGASASTAGAAPSTGGVATTETQGLTCAAPLSLCGSVCVDLSANANNCGACGNVCPAGQVCSGGVCTAACAAGLTLCGQSCVDLNSAILNCGACGVVCQAGQVCTAGVCTGTATGGDVSVPVTTADPAVSTTGGEPTGAATTGDPSVPDTGDNPSASGADQDPSAPGSPVSVAPTESSGCGCSAVGAGKVPFGAVFSALIGLWAFGWRRRRAGVR